MTMKCLKKFKDDITIFNYINIFPYIDYYKLLFFSFLNSKHF